MQIQNKVRKKNILQNGTKVVITQIAAENDMRVMESSTFTLNQ